MNTKGRDDDGSDDDGDDGNNDNAQRQRGGTRTGGLRNAVEQAEAERIRLGLDADHQERINAIISNRVKKDDEVVDVKFFAGLYG